MAKFRLLHQRLLLQGLAVEGQLHQPLPAPRRWLELVHARGYHQAFARGELGPSAERRIGLPATTPLVRRTWLAVGGTVLTARLALKHGLACHLAGGTHHAFPDYGSGFCIFNDCAVAARVLLAEGLVQRLMVIDLDVHQGDGTAAIFADEPRVFTVSAHCASNFPLRKQCSNVDLPLDDGLEDDDYLRAIGDLIPDLLEMGIAALNPIEPYGMDIRQVKKHYGRNLTLIGNMDVGGTLSEGTPDDVRAEARQLIDDVGREGSFVLASCHSITANVKPENFLAMVETAQTYGVY